MFLGSTRVPTNRPPRTAVDVFKSNFYHKIQIQNLTSDLLSRGIRFQGLVFISMSEFRDAVNNILSYRVSMRVAGAPRDQSTSVHHS